MSTIHVPGSGRHAVRHSALSIRIVAACAVLLFSGLCSAQLSTVTLISPLNGVNIATTTPTLAWAAFPGARTYWVQVYQYAQQVYSSPYTTNTQITVSPALPTGVELNWYVVAYGANGDPIAASDKWTFTVNGPPVLSISKRHAGNFTQGQTGATYTVTVSNQAGAGPTSTLVVVTETIPSGLSLVSMAGTGWTCAAGTCTRSDALAGGASYPPITVTVNVAGNATSPQVNAVRLSFGISGSANTTDSTIINSSALTVTCSAPLSGTVGTPYFWSTCTPSGGTAPYTWSWSGTTPPGLSINSSSGAVSGTPTTAGSYLVTVTVTDSSAPTRHTASQQFTIIINPSTLAVTCSAPLSGTVGTPYFWSTCTPSGGTAPYAWSWSGTIPPGLSINSSTGVVSGTPTTAGSYPVTVTVNDSSTPTRQTASQQFTIIINPSTLTVTCSAPLAGTVGTPYSWSTCTPSGGTAPYAWSWSGTIPPGLSINSSSGAVSGTPTTAGSYPVTVTVNDSSTPTRQIVSQQFGIIINSSTLAVTCSAPPSGTVGTPYSAAPCTASGGATPYTWSWSGRTPPGLSINSSSGAVSGTPTTAGSYPVTVTVTDSSTPTRQTASQQFTIIINPSGLTVACTAPASGTVGTSYSAAPCTTSGGATPYTWSWSGTIPPGLSINSSSGAVSGTPTTAGSYPVTVTVTDSSTPTRQTASQQFTIIINAKGLTVACSAPKG